MLKAYVGIAEPSGLESLLPDDHRGVQNLSARAARHPSRLAVCFWAVLPEEAASYIRSELEADNQAEALIALHALAVSLGPLSASALADCGEYSRQGRA